jgi:hypothetical protein
MVIPRVIKADLTLYTCVECPNGQQEGGDGYSGGYQRRERGAGAGAGTKVGSSAARF